MRGEQKQKTGKVSLYSWKAGLRGGYLTQQGGKLIWQTRKLSLHASKVSWWAGKLSWETGKVSQWGEKLNQATLGPDPSQPERDASANVTPKDPPHLVRAVSHRRAHGRGAGAFYTTEESSRGQV